MTQDEIIEMARQAGLSVTAPSWGYTEDYHFQGYEDKLKAFAKLVTEREREKLRNVAFFDMWYQEMNAAVLAEREACAKVAGETFDTAQPKREWVGLTDEEIYDYADKFLYQHGSNYGIKSFGKSIEAKLKQKNGYAEEKNT